MALSRRHFLAALAATPLLAKKDNLPKPGKSGIDHIVVVTMENRSFDHILGWLPGADGKQANSYPDANGQLHPTYHLLDYQGCGRQDPDHSYTGGRTEFNNGACDGWLRVNDEFSIGYYTQADLAFLGQAAPQWTTCDRFFAATMAETFPNRFYIHSAQTDRITNTLDISTLPTIWDRLQTAGVSCRYYFSDIPFLALWGVKYAPISRPIEDFLASAQSGTLPQVSFVDPRFLGAAQGLSGDDHPFSDIRNGEAFLDLIYRAITSGPNWDSTALVIHFDEWGGFFDHVAPTTAPDPNPSNGLRGFRVPALLISPWTFAPNVDHGVYDHTSILNMIEWRFGLDPLTVRDASATNLAAAFDFKAKKVPPPPSYNVPLGPFGVECTATSQASVPNEWDALLARARADGWPI